MARTRNQSKKKKKDFQALKEVLPDLYFEIIDSKFKSKPDVIPTEEPLCPRWNTVKCIRVPPFESGTYLVYDLHKNPHYQLPRDNRVDYDDKAREKDVDVQHITAEEFELPGIMYHYGNNSNVFQQYISPHIKDFHMDKVSPPAISMRMPRKGMTLK